MHFRVSGSGLGFDRLADLELRQNLLYLPSRFARQILSFLDSGFADTVKTPRHRQQTPAWPKKSKGSGRGSQTGWRHRIRRRRLRAATSRSHTQARLDFIQFYWVLPEFKRPQCHSRPTQNRERAPRGQRKATSRRLHTIFYYNRRNILDWTTPQCLAP